jgi:hypothetical protein
MDETDDVQELRKINEKIIELLGMDVSPPKDLDTSTYSNCHRTSVRYDGCAYDFFIYWKHYLKSDINNHGSK